MQWPLRPLAIAAAAWLALQGPSTAQQPMSARPPVPLPSWFTEIDTAGSGIVTREQFVAYRMRFFDQLDTNKDGVLTKDEFLRLAAPPFTLDALNSPPLAQQQAFYGTQFQAIDTNSDGKATRIEVQAYLELGFREFDVDNDGRITQEEARSAGGPCFWSSRPSLSPGVDLEEFLAFEIGRTLVLDANKDGKISLQEWLKIAGSPNQNPPGQLNYEQRRTVLVKRFREIDTNLDGQLDQAEIRAVAVALFKRFDFDGNGRITPREWQAVCTPQKPVRLH